LKISRKDRERFWKKVSFDSDNDCWLWTASGNGRGYGRIKINGRNESAHRVAWEIYHGKTIPYGKVICHTCDNPRCVNPKHLFIGTQRDNVRDAVNKGRNGYPKGEKHRWSKLTKDNVLLIREKHKNLGGKRIGKYIESMAKLYGVKYETIEAVIYGRTWKHLL